MTTKHGSSLWILAARVALLLGCGDDTGAEGSDTTASTTAADTTGDATDPDTGTGSSTGSSGDDTTGDSTGDPTGDSTSTTAGACELERPAIVTDIDETLTISDAEFIMQIADGNYDPIEREGGADLIGAYAELGYSIMYLTARSEDIMVLGTGETAREATERWLVEHGYPTDPSTTTVVLAPMFVFGDSARQYKAAALMDLQADGWRFDYAYGNADSDIGAYADAGIDPLVTFIIGEQGGQGGTVAVAGEGWVEHTAAHLPTVPAVCEDE